MHSKKFKKVRNYYNSGLWSKSMVHDAVVHSWITAEEYEEITEEPFEEVDE